MANIFLKCKKMQKLSSVVGGGEGGGMVIYD